MLGKRVGQVASKKKAALVSEAAGRCGVGGMRVLAHQLPSPRAEEGHQWQTRAALIEQRATLTQVGRVLS